MIALNHIYLLKGLNRHQYLLYCFFFLILLNIFYKFLIWYIYSRDNRARMSIENNLHFLVSSFKVSEHEFPEFNFLLLANRFVVLL